MRLTAGTLGLIMALPVLPQRLYHHDLAPAHDGAVLYFSYFRPEKNFGTKIFRWTATSGVELFADRPDLAEKPPLFRSHLYGADTTYSGTVIFHAEPACSTGTGPGFNTCSIGETQIVHPGQMPFSVEGFLLISPNGRYGVFATFEDRALWVDWVTGEEKEVAMPFQNVANVSPPFSVNQHAVANNGSFLIAGGDRVRVWSKDGEIVLRTTERARATAISADGSTVAITAREPGDQSEVVPTYVYSLATGSRRKFESSYVSMSGDGQVVAYLNGNPERPFAQSQAVIARNGQPDRQITNAPEGVRSVVLSEDGRYLFAAIGDNFGDERSFRIERRHLETGAVDVLPAVPR